MGMIKRFSCCVGGLAGGGECCLVGSVCNEPEKVAVMARLLMSSYKQNTLALVSMLLCIIWVLLVFVSLAMSSDEFDVKFRGVHDLRS